MSKYYKAEDVQELITACIWRMTLAKERNGEGFVEYDKQIIDVGELEKRLSYLPTIEVREDAISREDAIKALRLEYPSIPLFREMREGWHLKTEGYRKAEEIIKNAPSVVPGRNCGAKMKGMDDEIIVTDMSSEELELALDFAERVWGLSREETIEAIKKGDYVFRLEK